MYISEVILGLGGDALKLLLVFYTRQPTEKYPEVVDLLVGDRRTCNMKVKARTQDTDLYRFGPPE